MLLLSTEKKFFELQRIMVSAAMFPALVREPLGRLSSTETAS